MTPAVFDARVQEEFYGRTLIVADRDMVETECDTILENADVAEVALLVVGDHFGYKVFSIELKSTL